jgi:hypothetical protein
VIRYAYLWHSEAAAGQEEGLKDRPCAIVVASKIEAGRHRVHVLPVTHSPPSSQKFAMEIPAAVKQRLGLDDNLSWIVLTEANVFVWPGPDLRVKPGYGPESIAYGFLPPGFFEMVRDRYLRLDKEMKGSGAVRRTE